MDLRVKKTLLSIKKAFFLIRKRKPIDKISIKELSEKAMINKATFYLHYKDIYDLSESLEKELIKTIIDDVKECELDKSFAKYKTFINTLHFSMIEHKDEIDTLFSGERQLNFVEFLEEHIIEYLFEIMPEIRADIEFQMLISYMVYGSYYVLHKYEKEITRARLLELSGEFSLKLLKNK